MDHDVNGESSRAIRIVAPKSDKRRFKEETGWGGAGSPARAFLNRGDAAKRFVQMLCEWWARKYPFEVVGYQKEVQLLRETLRNGTGMARTKDFAQIGIMPSRVMALGEQLVPGFWTDGGKEIWFKEFPAFASRSSRMGRFGVSG